MTTTATQDYRPIPLAGLAGTAALDFPVYLATGPSSWVLYRDVSTRVDADHLGRLEAEGHDRLWIRAEDRTAYSRRIEGSLDTVLRDRALSLEHRAELLQGVASDVAEELLCSPPGKESVGRAQRMLSATSGLLLRERRGFSALRKVLGGSPDFVNHSLRVAFMTMGTVRGVMGADPNLLVHAGLGGLLHDVGRLLDATGATRKRSGEDAPEGDDSEPDHPRRGGDYLKKLALPGLIVDAAWFHHERFDGSGFPTGLRGLEIPEIARVVGMVDTFDGLWLQQEPPAGVFDTLRVMAQAWRDCFDPSVIAAFIELFRD